MLSVKARHQPHPKRLIFIANFDGDQFIDAALLFDVTQSEIQCGDISAVLLGRTFDGTVRSVLKFYNCKLPTTAAYLYTISSSTTLIETPPSAGFFIGTGHTSATLPDGNLTAKLPKPLWIRLVR